jgi:hypothetical protein
LALPAVQQRPALALVRAAAQPQQRAASALVEWVEEPVWPAQLL